MTYDLDARGGAPVGLTYAGIAVRLGEPPVPDVEPRQTVLDALAEARFSGWLGPAEPPWVIAVADNPEGSVAGGRTDLHNLAARLAAELGTVTLGISVLRDAALRLTLSVDSDVLGQYVSDPTVEMPDDDEIMPDPVGVEIAGPLVRACGQGSADDVT
ncbi:MAG TPA: hypothetical protein VN257_08040, partial [Actinotalea sp.]|nr:hypothetical protein [Actinotalea sp.]